MKIDLGKYRGNSDALGEVSGIDGVKLSIYVYPDKYSSISVGDIIVVNSDTYFPVMIVSKNLHRVKREQSFTPMRTDYETLKRVFPDVNRLYTYVVSGVLVAYLDLKGNVYRGIGPSPRIHDFVYKLDEIDKVSLMRGEGKIDFSILRYFVGFVRDTLLIREFILKNRLAISELGSESEVFNALFKVLLDAGLSDNDIRIICDDFLSIMGWI